MNPLELHIDPARLKFNFDALAQIGATGDGGVHRPTFSDAHLSARKWFRAQIENAGLEFRADGAHNHSAFLACGRFVIASRTFAPLSVNSAAKQSPNSNAEIASQRSLAMTTTLLLGSHLDSVPNGGRFDGALGVCAALEVLRVVKENNISLAMNLEAIDFTDEEGTLVGLLGSSAIAGKLKRESFQNPRGGRDNLLAGMQRAGVGEEGMLSAQRDNLGGYLEVHIEQGARLEKAGCNIGIVTDIVGITSYKVIFIGRADHAGTTSMQDRLDAAQGASAFCLAVREIALKNFPRGVVNVGKMEFVPGAFNIIPERVVVALEFRAPSVDELDRMEKAFLECAYREASRIRLAINLEFLGKHKPSPMRARARRAFEESCDALGLSRLNLVSGAGHDGQMLTSLCPVGMIFVPSVAGASHSPREFTNWDDCVNGANVLLHAALKIAA
ncbi:MAG: Zn-dependent hydrolase [Chloroflexi bacterium]|nr:Zn-dependent hydrolase [Chloroflexota bacterium]